MSRRQPIIWSVVQARPSSGSAAARRLRDQNFVTYLPQYSVRVRGGWSRVSLFDNYFFVAAGVGRERSINSTRGILRLLPGFLPVGFIESLREMENEHGVVVLPHRDVRRFLPGQKVTVESMRVPAIYLGQGQEQRSLVLLSLLGKAHRVEVQRGDLVAA